jgi:hypothetical protein
MMTYPQVMTAVLYHCPNPYAKAYARAGIQLFDPSDQRTQCLYVLSNLSHWRGDLARQCREALKRLAK